jgi:transposase
MAVMALLRFEPGVTSFQIVGLQAEVTQTIADYLGKHINVFMRSSVLIVVHRCQLNLKKRRCIVYEQLGQRDPT